MQKAAAQRYHPHFSPGLDFLARLINARPSARKIRIQGKSVENILSNDTI
jgi:hypothetical protein